MTFPSFSILIPTAGRASLLRTLESVVGQLHDEDEVIVDRNDLGDYGHVARERMLPRAKGDFVLFMDDDDTYVPGALDVARAAAGEQPLRLHLFRMRYPDGRELWEDRVLRVNNVSTQMIVCPNVPVSLGQWGPRYAGDYDFIASTCARMGPPVWHEQVIALIRPA